MPGPLPCLSLFALCVLLRSEEVLLYDLDIESMYNKGTWEELVDAKGLCIPCKAEIRVSGSMAAPRRGVVVVVMVVALCTQPSFGFLCAASLVERLPCPSRDPQLGREVMILA